jgi:hypothetical protein
MSSVTHVVVLEIRDEFERGWLEALGQAMDAFAVREGGDVPSPSLDQSPYVHVREVYAKEVAE